MNRPVCVAHEVRCILADAPELTCAQILERAELATTTTQIACVLATDRAAGLVIRAGERRHYRYTLTADGHRAAENPNYLRSGRRRRRTSHRSTTLDALVAQAVAHA